MDEPHRSEPYRPGVFATLAILTLTAMTTGACVAEPTVLDVITCGDLIEGREVTEIRISLLDADRTHLQSTVVPIVDCERGVIYEMPRVTRFREVSGETWIVAQGLNEGVETVRGETRALVDDEALLGVELSRDCIGVSCAAGQGCIEGKCRTLVLGQNPNICGQPPAGSSVSDYDCAHGGAN